MCRSDLHAFDLVEHRGLLVVDAPLAALQAAIALPDGSTFLDRALQKHVPFLGLYDCYCRNLGRRGWRQVSRLITAAADRADSAAERVLKGLLREAGITGWVLGHRFGPHLIDLAFPEQRVAVEVDGWAWHVDVDRFRADRRKGNALSRAGWTVLRFTWHDVVTRPSWSRRSGTPSPQRHDRQKWYPGDRSDAATPLPMIKPARSPRVARERRICRLHTTCGDHRGTPPGKIARSGGSTTNLSPSHHFWRSPRAIFA